MILVYFTGVYLFSGAYHGVASELQLFGLPGPSTDGSAGPEGPPGRPIGDFIVFCLFLN